MKVRDQQIPFPPDAQQLDILRSVAADGGTIASEGSERFELFNHLVDQGLLQRIYSKGACKVYQFTPTLQGMELIQ